MSEQTPHGDGVGSSALLGETPHARTCEQGCAGCDSCTDYYMAEMDEVAAFEAWFYGNKEHADLHCFTKEYGLARSAWKAGADHTPNA